MTLTRKILIAALTGLVGFVAPASAQAATFAATDPATSVHRTSTVLNGHLDPGTDSVTDCYFEWGTTTSYGNTTPCVEGTSFTTAEEVSVSIGGLSPSTNYHFRLHIEASSGDRLGGDRNFTTLAFPIGRPRIGSFGPDGTEATQFAFTEAQMAMDYALDRLYVFEHTSGDINAFDVSSGPPFSPVPGFAIDGVTGGKVPQIAVDNTGLASGGNIYYASNDANKVYGYSSSGAPLGGNFPIDPTVNPGGFTKTCGVAVKSNGEVWVGTNLGRRVLRYGASGAFIGSFSTNTPSPGPERDVCRLAFDDAERLYVVNLNGESYGVPGPDYAADLFAGRYTALDVDNWNPGAAAQVAQNSMAVDPALGRFFGTNSRDVGVVEDAFTGEHLNTIGSDITGATFNGVAADRDTHRVFAYDGASGPTHRRIYVFGAEGTVLVPTVETKPAGAVSDASATLRGRVDPEGLSLTDCHFEYGTSTTYNQTAPCSPPPGSGSGEVPVTAAISGLNPNRTYHYRVRASAAAGTSLGQDGTFTTPATAPAIKDLETLPVKAITNTTVRLRGELDPNGAPVTDCQFDLGLQTNYGQSFTCAPDPGAGTGLVSVVANVPGLEPGREYHARLQATNAGGTTLGEDVTFFTRGPPQVETVGSPVRTATTARLDARIYPVGVETSYHFEYGSQGPCDVSTCTATTPNDVGAGNSYKFVSQALNGLQPGTTYHYRVVADNGNADGPSFGEDMTLSTRADDNALTHGSFPGPPGSDRAWEQVNFDDTGGNPIPAGMSFSDDGTRAIYANSGGTEISETGSGFSIYFAERQEAEPHEGDWTTQILAPPRAELVGTNWITPFSDSDLLSGIAQNFGQGGVAVWRVVPGGTPALLLETDGARWGGYFMGADNGTTTVASLRGTFDPAHPVGVATPNSPHHFYDISDATPGLVSLLPDGSVPTCGLSNLGVNLSRRVDNELSADGTKLVFGSVGSGVCAGQPIHLYMRDLAAQTTTDLSGDVVSGTACNAKMVRQVESAVFFMTASRLTAADQVPNADCTSGNDLYRYDIAGDSLECVTCVVPGFAADVLTSAGSSRDAVGISGDGSTAYFASSHRLDSGSALKGLYRVDVSSGDFAYVAPAGDSPTGDYGVSALLSKGNVLSDDGETFIFYSKLDSLNQAGGSDNGDTEQYYRFSDADRSLVCISCPDGTAPAASEASPSLTAATFGPQVGPNTEPMSDDGAVFAFATPLSLVGADDNSAGPGEQALVGLDVYEWRDGERLLVSDGTTRWPGEAVAPAINGMSNDGSDVFFTASARLTPDAIDGYNRLYDARIGGGFNFPAPSQPCSLEECQGPPTAPPAEDSPGSSVSQGPGNLEPLDCSKLEGKLAKAEKRLKKAEGKKAKAKARTKARKATKRLAACEKGGK